MKHLIITAIFCGMLGSVYAQHTKTDSTKTVTDSVTAKHKHRGGFTLTINDDGTKVAVKSDDAYSEKSKPKKSKSRFSFGLTFENFELGFATLLDNGSFTLSPKNDFLQYRQIKTSNVSFDVIKFGYRFNDNFKLSLSGAFDWTLIRLQKNISIVPDVPTLTYVNDPVTYSKNRFSSNYFTMPLAFDFRTDVDRKGHRAHFVFGPETGFLIDGMQKQISSEHGKTKNFNDFHFAQFEYGAFGRITYGGAGIFVKYYFNDMFENSHDQQGLKNLSFGLTFDL